MEFLTGVYLVYAFVSFYSLFLFLLIYLKDKQNFNYSPPITKEYSLSVVVPCWNEEKTIGSVIENLLENDYCGLKKIIIVDDCSTDNSYAVINNYVQKYPQLIQLVQTPKNTGNAGGAKSYGSKFVKTELIGFTDADSFPKKDSISKMIGFFDDVQVGAVTASVLVKNRNTFVGKLQSIEYKFIRFSRKLLQYIDGIYATPGPLAIYRKTAFDDVGGFDVKNLTEDIEITWHLQMKGYKIMMSTGSFVYCESPENLKNWFKQRNRWNVGGLQTIIKYNKYWFRKGMLGNFILPFFVSSWVISIFGMGVLVYRLSRSFILELLSTKYSLAAETAFMTLKDINLTPNILVFFGLSVFALTLFSTFLALKNIEEKDYKSEGALSIMAFLIFYVMVWPIVLIISIYKLSLGKVAWR